MLRTLLSLVGLAVLSYVFLFVPLGHRTLYQHARRIAGTEEAQELGREAADAADELREHLEEQIERHILDAGPDAPLDGAPAEG